MKNKIIEFLKGFGTILLFCLLSILGTFIFKDYLYHDNKIIATLSQIGLYTIIFIGLCIPYYHRLINDFKNFKKDNVRIAIRNWLIGLGCMIISNLIVISLVGNIAPNESLNRSALTSYPLSNILTMALIGPILEEITFRLSFQKAFNKWYTFALFTSFIFGFAHILPTLPEILKTTSALKEILFIIPYSSLGFFFAKAFYETDNIYTSIIMHIIHNSLSILLIFLM